MSQIMRVDRADFLQKLEQVQPGLSSREVLQQSSCFAFTKGKVFTFNEEIACWTKSKLPKDFKAAVQAAPLLKILRKLPDKTLDISVGKKLLVLRGKGKQTRVRMEKEFLLPVDEVESPKEWKPIHPEFSDAINMVGECAGTDESVFKLVCIHITPRFIEAYDNLQMSRYRLKTGVDKSILVRRDSIKHVPGLDFSEFSETRSWIHFKGSSGLVMSFRRFVEEEEDFDDLTPVLKTTGTPTVLPKSLVKALDHASVFSEEDKSNNVVKVRLRVGKIKIVGQGDSGDHTEWKNMKYAGRPTSFLISPKLLSEIVKRHADCEIGKNCLIVKSGKFTYAASLEKPNKKEKKK